MSSHSKSEQRDELYSKQQHKRQGTKSRCQSIYKTLIRQTCVLLQHVKLTRIGLSFERFARHSGTINVDDAPSLLCTIDIESQMPDFYVHVDHSSFSRKGCRLSRRSSMSSCSRPAMPKSRHQSCPTERLKAKACKI